MKLTRMLPALCLGAAMAGPFALPAAADARVTTNRVTVYVWAEGATESEAKRDAERRVLARSYRRGIYFAEYRIVSSEVESCKKVRAGLNCEVRVTADHTYSSSSAR